MKSIAYAIVGVGLIAIAAFAPSASLFAPALCMFGVTFLVALVVRDEE
jgi:hypothetical protein